MATTTNNFSLPYPHGDDPYNIPEDIENLAKSIDSSLKAVSDSVATIDSSTTETVEEVQRNLEILEQEINRAGLPNIERIMVDIEEARDELEAAKEEFSVGQAELGVHLTNLRDERMPALEESVQEARNEMDTAMDEFMTRQTQFEDSISDAETDIADAKRRLGQNEEGVKEALEGEVDHDRLRVGTGGFDEVFAREVVAGIIGAEKAEVIDLIAEDLIANNATIINAAMQNLTVTERANFVDAFAKELYAERFTAEVARISNLTVAARNLIPGMFNIANEVPPPFDVDGFGVSTDDPSVWIQGTNTVNTSSEEDALIYLEAGVNYKFTVEAAASVPGTMYYVQLIDENGDTASDTAVELAETSYLLSQEIAGPNKDDWWPAESTFWVQKTGGYRLKIFANHSNGADNLTGYQWFHNMRVESMNDGQLIVPGSIDAGRLNAQEIFSNQLVSDEIWANIVRAKMLEAEEALIGGALIKNDTITVGKLTALDEILTEMLRVRKIEAGDISADAITADKIDANAITAGKIASKAIDGKTITGATIQTHSHSRRGVKMRQSDDGIIAFDSSGDQTVNIDGIDNYMHGRFYTNAPGEPGILLEPARSNQGPGVWFSEDGSPSSKWAAIWTSVNSKGYFHTLNIRPRKGKGGPGVVKLHGTTNADHLTVGSFHTKGGISVDKSSFLQRNVYLNGIGGKTEVSGRMDTLGPLYFYNLPSTTGWNQLRASGNSGLVYFYSSLRKNKLNSKTLSETDPYNILKVDPKVWYDKTDLKERLEELDLDIDDFVVETDNGPEIDEDAVMTALKGEMPMKVAGLIAEEVVDAGLETFAEYGVDSDTKEENTLQGVAYDRMWTLLIPIVRDQQERIESLEADNKILQDRLQEIEDRLSKLE